MDRLLTLDSDTDSVRRLSVAALEAGATQGDSLSARAARKALGIYKSRIDDGSSVDDALVGAMQVLRASLNGG